MTLICRILSAIFYAEKTHATPAPTRRQVWIDNAGKFAAAKMATDDTSLALIWADSPLTLAETIPWLELLVAAS